ncbi:flagellar basal body-associated FliL family protein [Pleomorphomonas sp. JP5]|uniref:flagellar basal body-associated FliL family protein n=1 Tax=Pleomorphomonas sp. JP5 TaxID=2942998 RepID=UPI00204435B8|nr:flagellar basal body-associated FliL family protein [Pleomorphomonas sp. JP5]MCM5556400.1 flagellar basal body-associated FliL family protein [Pleomorphomonas sp. JP5]
MAKLPLPGVRDVAPSETEAEVRRPTPPERGGVLKPAFFLTVLAIAAGLGLGVHLVRYAQIADAGQQQEASAGGERDPLTSRLYRLKPIVTNLTEPADVWLRLDAAIVFEDEMPNSDIVSAEISEDLLAFLKTLRVEQLEGATQLQHLREDLRDRVAIRSGGDVRDLIIESLVVQ